MRSLASFLSVVFIGASFLTACDTIENPIPKGFDQLTAAEGLQLDSVEARNGIEPAVKKVLLEDYTGHSCGNCPGAAVMAKNQQNLYGNRLVVMAVHAGYFAKYDKEPFTTNFTTPEGEEWATSFGVIANPNGMVNRMPRANSSNTVQGVALWPAAIATEMAKAPEAGMTLTTVYKPETRKVNIKVRSEYLAAKTGRFNLAVFILEDSIVSYQKNYSSSAGGDPAYPVGNVPNYVHPHALRLAVAGGLGRQNIENPLPGNVTEAYFTATLDNAWRAKKCSVVAFLYNGTTREIIQVEEKYLF